MIDIFSDDARRNPYPIYDHLRGASPVLHVPPPFNGWMVFDYEGVKRILNDHDCFSSAVPAPPNWFTFSDPPRHTKLRALISRAFIPRVVTSIEPRIREISKQLLDQKIAAGRMDLATEYAVPLPMKVIAGMIGIPDSDWERFKRWSDTILRISLARSGGEQAAQAGQDFRAVTAEISAALAEMIAMRRRDPTDDLLTRLVEAEVDGEHLSHDQILGFFQLLLVGGQETTANLINNAMLSLIENPDQLARLKDRPDLLPSAIEEALRFRSPVQWVMRTPRHDIEMHGQTLPAGQLVLPMLGSANRDPRQFPDANRFDIARHPNPHIAFGQGIHFCLGAPLARTEAKIALSDLLARLNNLELDGSEPWPPRQALHVHGPASLPIRFEPAR